MSIKDKLLESTAEKVRYCFTNKAFLKKNTEKGVHVSLENFDKKVNVFLPTEDALKMFLQLRESLRGVIAETSDSDKLFLQVLVERDAWGLERILNRKSHVKEDLGL